jgi:hypothetical protein
MDITHIKAVGLFVAGGVFVAGVALAADSRFDEAEANVNKAIALVTAAEVPAGKPIAARKKQRALDALEHAKKRIACAKEAADGKVKVFCKFKEDDEDDRGPKKDEGRNPRKDEDRGPRKDDGKPKR